MAPKIQITFFQHCSQVKSIPVFPKVESNFGAGERLSTEPGILGIVKNNMPEIPITIIIHSSIAVLPLKEPSFGTVERSAYNRYYGVEAADNGERLLVNYNVFVFLE